MTKLRVFAGTFDHASAGETFSPPHIRIGSSAACLRVSIPPSVKVDDVRVNGAAAAALVQNISAAPNAVYRLSMSPPSQSVERNVTLRNRCCHFGKRKAPDARAAGALLRT